MKIYITVLLSLLSFNNSNSQWITQPVPDSISVILSMDFTDPQNGAGAGNNSQSNFSGKAIYTTNAGKNWVSATVPDSSRTLITMQFINSATGYSSGAYNLFFNGNDIAAGKNNSNVLSSGYFRTDYDMVRGIKTNGPVDYKGLFFKTTDAGRSWNTFGNLPDSVYYLLGLHFINANTGFATAAFNYSGGVDDRIIKTTNGGISWLQLPMPEVINSLRNIFFTDVNSGYAVGYKITNDTPRAVILKTINSGASWTLQIFPGIVEFKDINFSNSLTGFAVGSEGSKFSLIGSVIYKTTNAGINWTIPLALNDVFLGSIKFVPGSGVGFTSGSRQNAVSSRISLTKTTDYGESWRSQILNDSGFAVNNFLLDQSNWYMSCLYNDHSFILHTTNGGTGISTVNNSVPDDFKLYQNYPNPFNPVTQIKYTIDKRYFVSLRVYDLLGKEVTTLVNENMNEGSHEINFAANNLSSGVYFYSLYLSGNFADTKRMILLN